MAGKNQPPQRVRVISYTTRTKAAQIRKMRERLRSATTRRVKVPRR